MALSLRRLAASESRAEILNEVEGPRRERWEHYSFPYVHVLCWPGRHSYYRRAEIMNIVPEPER
jgi:hypothetical protein